MNPKLAGQIRHFLTSGGWLIFVLAFLSLFLKQEYWDNALANAQKLKSLVGVLGLGGGGLALLGHYLSAKDKDSRDEQETNVTETNNENENSNP